MRATLLIENIGELATPVGSTARQGAVMRELRIVRDAVVAVDVETIAWAGPASELPRLEGPPPARLDARGRAVVPGFVDSHTHFVFGGYREDEFFWRAEGLPYMEIHARGGGIANSVRDTRAASAEELTAAAAARLERMLELGVTTVEGKSGYGLDLETELRQLEVMRLLDSRQPVDIVSTYMGPHSVPAEFKGNPSGYIDFVLREVMPRVKEGGLARFCDVFCERGVFELDDSRRFLEAAKSMGFGVKLHADEIVRLGGAGLAAEIGAVSADHLLKASEDDLLAMAEAGVVATCLPLTAFSLREPYAPARAMIDRGLAVAVASDLNPGS
ncbi:MAG TPA: imidazolonepropionase, partial [Spirochaetales bacterium]|nr:imidazolonepropionase [Spirochaetales bacterium]